MSRSLLPKNFFLSFLCRPRKAFLSRVKGSEGQSPHQTWEIEGALDLRRRFANFSRPDLKQLKCWSLNLYFVTISPELLQKFYELAPTGVEFDGCVLKFNLQSTTFMDPLPLTRALKQFNFIRRWEFFEDAEMQTSPHRGRKQFGALQALETNFFLIANRGRRECDGEAS